jgi:hypothetical protein
LVAGRYRWVRFAYGDGNYPAARRLALQAFRKAPWALESWRTLGLAALGPGAGALLRVRRALLGR